VYLHYNSLRLLVFHKGTKEPILRSRVTAVKLNNAINSLVRIEKKYFLILRISALANNGVVVENSEVVGLAPEAGSEEVYSAKTLRES
jgi:hypothetical protein